MFAPRYELGHGPIYVYYDLSPVRSGAQIITSSCPPVKYAFPYTVTIIACVLHLSNVFLHKNTLMPFVLNILFPRSPFPQLPSSDATMHERPAGKVGMYTRFFDYANYRIPFSTFFVSVLTHFRIPFSQLSVFGSAKDRAPAPSEYNVEHVNTLIAQASPFLRFPEEFLCWVGISLMDLNAFIRTADPPTYPTSDLRVRSRELSASVEREFVGDASVGDGGDQGFDSAVGQEIVEPSVPVTEPVEAAVPKPKRSKKKRSLSALNRLLQDSRLTVEQGVPALPTLPFITSSVTASPLEEGGDRTDSVTGPSLRTIGPSARFVVLSDSSHHSGANSAGPEVDSLVRSAAPVMTEAITVATTVAIPADISKDKSAPHPSVFGSSSSSEKTDRTLSLFTGRSGSGFDAGSIRAEETVGAGSEEIYVPEWTVTKGFEMNDGRLCANMIDHFTPPAFFKTVRGMEHEQLFTEFNVSAARNLSLSSEVRMRAEYNILEKRKWRSLAEEKNILLEAKDKEIEDLKSQLLKAKEESAEVTQLRAQVSGLEATENSLRGEVASAKDHNVLLEQECNSLKLKVTGLESTIAEKDHELSDLGASSSSLKSQNQSLVDQVHELEISSTDLREKLEMYEGSLKQLEEFQDNLMRPLRTRLAEIDADFTRCCMRSQESFHPYLLNVVAGRRWLLTHGMKLLVVKCLNSNEYIEAVGHAFGRAIEKGIHEGLAAGIEHGQASICLTDLEAYIPFAKDDFNSAIRDLRDLNFPLLKELSDKKDASTWDIMDLLRLDDTVAETLGMTDLQPDVNQLMVPVHHKQDRVVIGSQALSVALDICRGRVEKMERNLIERLPFLKDVFVSIDDPLSAEALIEPPAEVPSTNVLSTVVIIPHAEPSVSVEDYDKPDSSDVGGGGVWGGGGCGGAITEERIPWVRKRRKD
ncbi:hypothetical protein Tco_0486776 [Tanacetum coccineum]